jgi:hypothetical protein
MNSLGKSTHLYNGSEYIYANHGFSGHPFFESNSMQQGTIEYDGTVYENIPFSYDLVQDRVFITDSSMNFNIQLQNERVQFFSILGHTFIRLGSDSSLGNAPGTGFYDLLYDGKVRVLVRRTKILTQSFKAEEPMKYTGYNEYFIRTSSGYYRVDGRKSLFFVFRDEKDRTRKNFRKNHLNYRKDPEGAIVETARYYASLKN